MSNPVGKLLTQTKIGFPLSQKLLVTTIVLVYVISPIDLIPDIPVLGWPDDIFAVYLLIRVWASPTLPASVNTVPPSPAQAQQQSAMFAATPPTHVVRINAATIVADADATLVETKREVS